MLRGKFHLNDILMNESKLKPDHTTMFHSYVLTDDVTYLNDVKRNNSISGLWHCCVLKKNEKKKVKYEELSNTVT